MKICTLPVLLAIVLLCSCQKELSIENGANGPVLNGLNDSIFLDKVVEVWDGTDTTITQFNYDNLKRVASVIETNYTTVIVPEDTSIVNFFYNGLDTLPYKSIDEYRTTFPLQIAYIVSYDTSFIFWDAQKRIVLDSTISNYGIGNSYQRNKIIRSRQYSSGRIVYLENTTQIGGVSNGGFSPPLNDTAWLDANNNIIADVSYEVNTFPTTHTELSYKGAYTYDDKPNPYLTLNVFKVLSNNHGHKSWFTQQVNNYLTYHSEEPTYTTFNLTVQNFYNSKGQLIKAVARDALNNITNERYFFYRAL